MPCTYSRARSDRLKQSVFQTLKIVSLIPRRAVEQNSRLISLLKGLTVHVDDEGLEKIKELMDSVCLENWMRH